VAALRHTTALAAWGLARDTALAAPGWVVLRLGYADVRRDPELIRRRVLEVYAMRAAQLRVG
jgi:very-short-patch-repair endonuclease